MDLRSVTITKKRIKNFNLRIRRDKSIHLSVPLGTSNEAIQKFLKAKEAWITKTLASMPDIPKVSYADGEIHYLLGEKIKISDDGTLTKSFHAESNVIKFHPSVETGERDVLFKTYCMEQLASVLAELINYWAPIMNVHPGRITIRPTISQWGSCNVKTGQLSFACDLASKPVRLIEAVVVHELCHLLERNHNKRFYQLLEAWIPDYKERKKELASFPREFW